MIKFVDIETGNLFSGKQPYIHWLGKEQSVNMVYTQCVCYISTEQESVVSIEHNDIFKLLDCSTLSDILFEDINGFEYHNIDDLIVIDDKLISKGVYHRDYYVHIIYILAKANQAGEYIAEFNIDGENYSIGADFYSENESLKINLSNLGVELPESIQKALYDVNVHEDKIDYIVINRKWKELLSNYWDVIANKGSYISLYNSLKWFEYGDMVKLCELWKTNIVGRDVFNVKSIQSILSDKFYGSLNSFAKTTYVALYCALENPQISDDNYVYDLEGNPELKHLSAKWSVADLSLKLCMLGNFYETYFMPIHADLIHSTIEDVVYTNTFKIAQTTLSEREDFVDNFGEVECNIEDGQVFYLGEVECYVGKDTLFGVQLDSNMDPDEEIISIGVQTEVPAYTFSPDMQTELSQMYKTIGSIIDFDIKIPLQVGDKIKRSQLFIRTYNKNQEPVVKTINEYKILEESIKFKLLNSSVGEYDVRLQFYSISGKIFTKNIKYKVEDIGVAELKLYKIVPVVDNNTKITDAYNPFAPNNNNLNHNMYSFKSIDYGTGLYSQCIPAKTGESGPQLSYLLILKNIDDSTFKKCTSIKRNFFITNKSAYYNEKFELVDSNDKVNEYTICIMKYLGNTHEDRVTKTDYNRIKRFLYRKDYIFVPEFHKLVDLYENEFGDKVGYYIDQYTAVCVKPSISINKPINTWEWKFTNQSKPWEEPIIPTVSIREPIIAPNAARLLTPGYYKVEFKYSLSNEDQINTIVIDSAFVIR